MSQTLKLQNFDEENIIDQTVLTASLDIGAGTLPVENTQDFSIDGFVFVGTTGSKIGELQQIASVTPATSIDLFGSLLIPHNAGSPIYMLYGDQLRIYRAADAGQGNQPADSSFSLIDTIGIDPNDALTIYVDATGGGSYWYKYTHYNSVSTNESSLAAAVAVRGTFTVAYCSLDEVRQEAGFNFAPYITDDLIDQKRQAAQDTINGTLDEFYDTPLQAPIPDSLRQICIVLAAGYLRQAQYSQISDPQVNGGAKVKWAEGELKKLSLKERVLVNKSGQKLDGLGASGGVEGWPNSSTATTPANQGGAPRVFRMSDIQGRPQSLDPSGNPVGNLFYGRRW